MSSGTSFPGPDSPPPGLSVLSPRSLWASYAAGPLTHHDHGGRRHSTCYLCFSSEPPPFLQPTRKSSMCLHGALHPPPFCLLHCSSCSWSCFQMPKSYPNRQKATFSNKFLYDPQSQKCPVLPLNSGNTLALIWPSAPSSLYS